MCLYPTLRKNPRYKKTKKNGGIIPAVWDTRALYVPTGCGQCMECKNQKAREWQVRLLEDIKTNKNGKFITLTFSNESITEISKKINLIRTKSKWKTYRDKNGKERTRWKYTEKEIEKQAAGYTRDNAIATYAIRHFLESWRKKNGKSLRHWLVTELGHQGTENIHLHGIVWTDEIERIRHTWKYGFSWTGKEINGKIHNYVNQRTVNYSVKYVNKMDLDHLYYNPIILTSAGIGADYIKTLNAHLNRFIVRS